MGTRTEEQRQRYAADDKAHHQDHRRLDIAREIGDLLFEFHFSKVGDLFHYKPQLAALFAAVEHLRDRPRHEWTLEQWLGELFACLDLIADDMSAAYDKPAPTWAAGALIALQMPLP